ncbi:MAG: hypothetical protein HYW07_21940 [Candidatus Latescibacteria bacterium]|nr:hypothetical protein [Candidatus Latescibacterota bacterium]
MALPEWRHLRRIADYTFAIEGDDPLLAEVAAELYSGAPAEGGRPQTCFACQRLEGGFALRQRGRLLARGQTLAGFFQKAEWALTHQALLRLGHFFQVHAGSAARQGLAQLLVGPPESGKTSLVLALALRGWSLLGDEIALIEAPSLRVWACHRDLILRPGTRALLLPEMAQVPDFKWVEGDCYFSPRLAGPPPEGPAELAGLVFPALRPGARVEWARLGWAEAARRLLEQAMNLGDWAAEGMELVGRLVERCPAVELVFGDAREAAEIISEI